MTKMSSYFLFVFAVLSEKPFALKPVAGACHTKWLLFTEAVPQSDSPAMPQLACNASKNSLHILLTRLTRRISVFVDS